MIHLLVGLFFGGLVVWLIFFLRVHRIRLRWWHWVLGLILFGYFLFILELVISFLEEGTIRGALVMGVIFGFIGLVGGLLFWRLIISPQKKSKGIALSPGTIDTESSSLDSVMSSEKGEEK
ncbi:hypothetical protein NLC35_02550 [Candidatus Aminicenantes bacterium AC-334-K16]|jgi:hypothetical protein|nr:hypothetical protein [Candidatus Aminicenantes bacterium AC-334-K16]